MRLPCDLADQYMPPSSGIPPPERPSDFAAGSSQTTASVLRSNAAMDAAFCKAGLLMVRENAGRAW